MDSKNKNEKAESKEYLNSCLAVVLSELKKISLSLNNIKGFIYVMSHVKDIDDLKELRAYHSAMLEGYISEKQYNEMVQKLIYEQTTQSN